jgi:PadR family transcriptional regulator, regulatory protein PadR
MPKPDSLQGSLDLLVLKILSRRPRSHGYAIMTAIQNMSGEVLRAEEGSLYPALHRMEEAGFALSGSPKTPGGAPVCMN